MNKLIKIATVFLSLLIVVQLVLLKAPHHSPTNPKSFILNIAVEGSGSYQMSLWIPTGSTSDSVPGIAHVLEHLKFKNHDGDGFSGFDAIAGSSSNAATSYRTTHYDLNVPPEGVDKALQILAGMTKPLVVTDEDVKLEKTVVGQELLQRMQSDPDAAFYREFYTDLYKGTRYENTPGGTQESVSSVTLNDVLAFDKNQYQGSKSFLLIMGPPLNDDQRAAIETNFPNSALGNINIGHKFKITKGDAELMAADPILPTEVTPAISVSEIKHEKTSPRAQTVKLTVTKLINAPTSWRSLAASQILQSAMRSRLSEGLQDRIAEDNRIVQRWSVSIGRLLEGVWQIEFSAAVEKGVAPEVVRAAFENYFSNFATTGLSQSSFDRLKARNFLTSEWEEVEGRGTNLASDSVEFGYGKAVSFLDELQKTELRDVNDLLLALNKPGRVGELKLKPEGLDQ